MKFQSVLTKAICMFALAIASNSFTLLQAQTTASYLTTNSSFSGDVRFIRMDGDMLVFELLLNNLPAKGSLVRISDGDNNIILEEKISTETYQVRYKIAKENIRRINFEVLGRKIFLQRSFNVGSRLEEKIEVTKV